VFHRPSIAPLRAKGFESSFRLGQRTRAAMKPVSEFHAAAGKDRRPNVTVV
jgi:hypothetical protein